MNNLDYKNEIRNYLMKTIKVTDIDDEENLFEKGIVKSLFALQLVTFVEDTFQIRVENFEMDLVNFCSIEEMAKFVKSKKQAVQ